MKIILVEGPANSGKTTVINKVFDNISKDEVIMPREQVGGDKHDFQAVVQHNGKRIGFYSMGDYEDCVKNNIELFATQHKCDILIIANSNFSGVSRFIEEIKADCTIVQKDYPANDTTKDKAVNEILSAIDEQF